MNMNMNLTILKNGVEVESLGKSGCEAYQDLAFLLLNRETLSVFEIDKTKKVIFAQKEISIDDNLLKFQYYFKNIDEYVLG